MTAPARVDAAKMVNRLRTMRRPYGDNTPWAEALDAAIAALERVAEPVVPVAWVKQDSIYDDAGRPIGEDEPRVVYSTESPDPSEGWAPLYLHPSSYANPPDADEALIERLQRVASTLDHFLGDTDPDLSDMDDEEVRWTYPVFWCCQELNTTTRALAACDRANDGEG